MWWREPGCLTSGSISHFPLLLSPKNPNLQSAKDVDALLLGMASQIAEKEDHVVVEDVRGEPETVPTGCGSLVPGRRFSRISRAEKGGVQSWEPAVQSLLRELLTLPLLGSSAPGVGWSHLAWRPHWLPLSSL